MTHLSKYKLALIISSLFILIAGYSLFEYIQSENNKKQDDIIPVIHRSLNHAETLFNEVYEDLQSQSEDIFQIVEQSLLSNHDRMTIHNRLNSFDLWGISIKRNSVNWLWKGFELRPAANELPADTINTSVVNYNNVVLLLRTQTFSIEDEPFSLVTAKRIAQTTDLPFVKNVEYQLTDEPVLMNEYPVEFNFFSSIPEGAFYRTLATSQNDSIGTVYATLESSNTFFGNPDIGFLQWRMLFQIILFISFFLVLYLWASAKKSFLVSYSQILLITGLWVITLQSGVVNYWISVFVSITNHPDSESISHLAYYISNSVFLFLLFISLHTLLSFTKKPQKNERHYRTFLFSLLVGMLGVLLLLYFNISTQNILVKSNLELHDLELAPSLLSFTFYIFSSLFFVAAAGIIISAGYHLFFSEEDKSAIIAVLSFISFICFYLLADLVLEQVYFFSWALILNACLFMIFLFVIQSFHKYSAVLKRMSGFRKLMLIVLAASSTIYIIIWNSMNARMDRDLLHQIDTFTEEDATSNRDILHQLLTEIETDLTEFSQDDLEENLPNLQSQFQRAVQANINDAWHGHAFHIKLLSTNNEEITTYSTTIQTPAWSSFFSTDLMTRSYRGQQLRRQTNRPIIWGRPSNISDRYIALDRGWIPIYDQNQANTIIAWVAGEVFRERADYNKPLRAVLSAASPNDWKQSFYVAEFFGGQLSRNTIVGIYQNQPQHNRLPAREAQIAAQDSIRFITNHSTGGIFREVIVRDEGEVIYKASTPIPGLNHHLFSYFRLQIVLIFFGLFCFSIFAMCGLNEFSLFGQNRKFKDRLIDGLTLATIIFLTALIFTTQYAVSIQNEKNVERALVTALGNLTESIKDKAVFTPGISTDSLLSELSTPLNIDLVLYEGASVAGSTTPQIFQQYLMPATLAYPVFDFLFNRQRNHYVTTTNIGDEEMLIGYRSLIDAEGQPVGAIAIPTFIQSPVYKEQLLETTSYLLVVYLIIFSLFIIGTVILSNQLTKPLQIIQLGLNKISRGDMNTKVAVTSRDEIGSIANAYNTMVQRLDHAQKELMKAERESAWKEMAQQVAHEIKNPLTPMKLNLQHLQRQLENNPDKAFELKPVIEQTAANIIEQIESLNKIASDFSKFAKPVQQPMEKTELIPLVHSVAELYKFDSTSISLELPPQKISIMGVEDELRRAFINLIKNAIEASRNGESALHINLQKHRKYVLIQIQDNGIGIDDNDKEKIFLPKFSTKSSGTGLGLAITKKIIEAHNGKIWVESKKGEGSSFFIRLPYA